MQNAQKTLEAEEIHFLSHWLGYFDNNCPQLCKDIVKNQRVFYETPCTLAKIN